MWAILLLSALAGGPEWRQPTPAELEAVTSRLDQVVADPDYQIVEAIAAETSNGTPLVFVKVRCRGPLGGPILQSWRVSIVDGRGELTMQLPYPDVQAGTGGEQRPHRPHQTANLAGRLPPPPDKGPRYVVVYSEGAATVYAWTGRRWRELGPALAIRAEAVPPPIVPGESPRPGTSHD